MANEVDGMAALTGNIMDKMFILFTIEPWIYEIKRWPVSNIQNVKPI